MLPKFTFEQCDLSAVFKDFEWYSRSPSRRAAHHQGTLLQHSQWTADAVHSWIATGDARTRHIKHDGNSELAILLALFHDIGKAGDGDKTAKKPRHDHTGYEYAMGSRTFFMMSPNSVMVKVKGLLTYFSKCPGITHDIIVLMGIVSEMHFDFGKLMAGKKTCSDWVEHFVYVCEYCDFVPKKNSIKKTLKLTQLARIILAVSMADVAGAWPKVTPKGLDDNQRPWLRLGYENWKLNHKLVMNQLKKSTFL